MPTPTPAPRKLWRALAASVAMLALTAGPQVGCATTAPNGTAPVARPAADDAPFRVVQTFGRLTPTGVAVSGRGRTFVGFADLPESSLNNPLRLAELTADGDATPYPSKSWNNWRGEPGGQALRGLIDVRGVWIDPDDTLWVLDSGVNGPRVVPGGPKLMRVDLADDEVAEVFYLPTDGEISRWTAMSDVRVDAERRVAYFLDARRGRVVMFHLDDRHAWSVRVADPAPKRSQGGAIELAGMGDWLYVSDPAAGAIRVTPTSLLREPEPKDGREDAPAQPLASTEGSIEGLWLDGDGRLFMLRPEDGTLLVRGTDRAVREAWADPILTRANRVAADHRGRLFVTVAPHPVRGWGQAVTPETGALIELTHGRSAARVRNVVAPMTLGSEWPTPSDPLRVTDRLAEKAARDDLDPLDHGIAPAPIAQHPPAGISVEGVLVEAPIESFATDSALAEVESEDAPADEPFGAKQPDRGADVEVPSARFEIDAESDGDAPEPFAEVPVTE
ncbi:MAG: L-dopachrome tautomerase-related protein [Planctomycetota bacterium]